MPVKWILIIKVFYPAMAVTSDTPFPPRRFGNLPPKGVGMSVSAGVPQAQTESGGLGLAGAATYSEAA